MDKNKLTRRNTISNIKPKPDEYKNKKPGRSNPIKDKIILGKVKLKAPKKAMKKGGKA